METFFALVVLSNYRQRGERETDCDGTGEMLFPPPKLYATIEPLIRQKVEPAAAPNARAKWILSQDVRIESCFVVRPTGPVNLRGNIMEGAFTLKILILDSQ